MCAHRAALRRSRRDALRGRGRSLQSCGWAALGVCSMPKSVYCFERPPMLRAWWLGCLWSAETAGKVNALWLALDGVPRSDDAHPELVYCGLAEHHGGGPLATGAARDVGGPCASGLTSQTQPKHVHANSTTQTSANTKQQRRQDPQHDLLVPGRQVLNKAHPHSEACPKNHRTHQKIGSVRQTIRASPSQPGRQFKPNKAHQTPLLSSRTTLSAHAVAPPALA
jgi:hypothetical protein